MATIPATPCQARNGTYRCEREAHVDRHTMTEKVRDASNRVILIRTFRWSDAYSPVTHTTEVRP